MSDKYSCDTVSLTSFKSPIYPVYFTNNVTGLDYFFLPIIEIIESPTDVRDITPVGKATVRNRNAWEWKATLLGKRT